MDNNNSFDTEIKDAVSNINRSATESAPEPNWIGVLGRSDSASSRKGIALVAIKSHKLVSAAASILLVALIGVPLAITLTDGGGDKTVKTADKKKTTTTLPKTETTTSITVAPVDPVGESTAPTTTPKATAATKPPATKPAPVIPARPGNPSGLQFTGNDLVGPPGDPATYNVFFSWNASSTANVKYCVTTNAEGAAHDLSCSWDKPYIDDQTSRGFGLVFKKNTTYSFKVTAVDQNNQKSDTIVLNWQLP